jgi:prepilin-type N-terminal cleavage/methylation domain-containing protein
VFLLKKIKLRAFTLIELMAVVLIIGILSMITVSAVNYSIKNAKEKLYAEQIDRLESGVSSWAIENTDLLPSDGTGIVFFSVDRLKDEGIVDSELITDPRNNEELTGCMIIVYNETYKQYEYKYEELSCENVSGAYLPTITVVNGLNQFLEVNEEYSFPAATAVDYTGRSVAVTGPIIRNSSNQIVSTIDSSIVGSTYTLSYSSTDLNLDLTKVDNVTLTIRDTVAPTITCGTSSVSYSVTHPAGPGFVNPTCVTKDNSCGTNGTTTTVNGCTSTLTPQITATGFTQTIPGTYSIYYTATDSSANTKVFTVTIVVEDITPPGVPTVTAKLNTSTGANYNGATTWTNQNVWLGLNAFEEGSGIQFYQQSINCTGTYTTITPNGTDFYLHSVASGAVFNGNICFRARDNVDLDGNAATVPIRIDKVNPAVSFGTNGNATWGTSRSTTVTVTDANSGVNPSSLNYQWTTDTSAPTEASFTAAPLTNKGTFTSGATITTPAGVSGTYYLWILAKDNADNTVITRTNVFNLDNGVPTITASNASSSWFTSRTATITGTDNVSVSEIRYHWDSNPMNSTCTSGGTVTTTGTALPVASGSHGLYLCIRDSSGNTAEWYSGANQYRVDITGPTNPTVIINESWTNAATVAGTISGSIDSESGFSRYQYTMSGATNVATWTDATSLIVANVGTTTINVRAVDNVGNVSSTITRTVRIDRTAPVCVSSGGSSTWRNTNLTITGTCSDALSGCSGTVTSTFSVNTNTATASPGAYSFTDAAGNTGSGTCPADQTVRIDKTAPTCASSGGSTSWTSGTRTITGTCSDTGGSGCAGNRTYTYSTTTSINITNGSPQGSVSDNATNSSATCPANQTVRIDRIAPTATYSVNRGGDNCSASVSGMVTTEAHSGLNSAGYIRWTKNGVVGSWGTTTTEMVLGSSSTLSFELRDNVSNTRSYIVKGPGCLSEY